MLKRQQPGPWRFRVAANTPVVPHVASQLDEVAATARTVRPFPFGLAEGFVVGIEPSDDLPELSCMSSSLFAAPSHAESMYRFIKSMTGWS